MTEISMTYRLGGETEVNRLGYGVMRLTGQPGNFGPYEDWAGGLTVLRRAADLGVNFFDSAWAYQRVAQMRCQVLRSAISIPSTAA